MGTEAVDNISLRHKGKVICSIVDANEKGAGNVSTSGREKPVSTAVVPSLTRAVNRHPALSTKTEEN